ncbi:hypothetical protein, partial [Oleiagrimonas sp.]|uniref:hypothetical protein n=1 Tax=Oleiagrimonas sp. TaxID=2010330 RepID=UPI002601D576
MKYRFLVILAVLLVTGLLYWPSLHAAFLFDDIPNLSALDSIQHLSSWRDLGIYLSQPRGFPGRPLAMLSFLLQKASWPDDPFAFRLVNLGIHLFNGVLVYLLVHRLARKWLAEKIDPEALDARAFLAAGLAMAAWLLNPIQLAGVVLVVQRMTLLAGMFVLLGLLAYLRGLLAEHLSSLRRGLWMVIGLGLCMGLSFLCKENGILLPLFALVLDATLLRTNVRHLPSKLLWLRRFLIWPVTLFVFGFLLWSIPVQWGHPGIRDFTVGERLLTEPRILFNYLGKIFLPHFGIYGLYHDGYTVSHGLLSPWTTLPALLALLGLLGVAFAGLRRWPLLALAILWYLGGQLLESSSVMLELYFEHRNYMPLVGIVLALALAIARLPRGSLRNLVLALFALWIAACSFTTALSARVYASEDSLALTWASAQPDSIRAQTFLAQRLFKHGQLDSALDVINRAAAHYPKDASLAENRVYLKCMQGSLTSEGVDQLEKLLRSAPYDRGGFNNMETLRKLASTGHCPALNPKRWLRLDNTLLSNPAYAKDGIAAGFLHYQKHFWAVQQGNLTMAIQQLKEAYKNDPDANIPRMEAKYLVSAGLYKQAIATLEDTNYARLPLLRRLLVNDRA